MESTDSSTGSQQPQLPPGFRFHPTDEELVVHYLKKKAASVPLPVSIIAEVDLYKFDPWELPEKATFGEQEWYFFSPRDRKYPNGARPNRAATSGYWKATGTDKPVMTAGGVKVGVKKALVFYGGKPPKGIKSNWIMHEYRVIGNKDCSKPPGCDFSKKGSLRLDDWVLCRIYKKAITPRPMERDSDDINDMIQSMPSSSLSVSDHQKLQGLKTTNFGGFLQNEHSLFDGMLTTDGRSISQLTPSISASQFPLFSGSSFNALPAAKRTFSQLYYNDENDNISPSSAAKRFMTDINDGTNIEQRSTDDQTNPYTSLLGQISSQNSQMQPPAMLGSLPDGIFRQIPGINWYS